MNSQWLPAPPLLYFHVFLFLSWLARCISSLQEFRIILSQDGQRAGFFGVHHSRDPPCDESWRLFGLGFYSRHAKHSILWHQHVHSSCSNQFSDVQCSKRNHYKVIHLWDLNCWRDPVIVLAKARLNCIRWKLLRCLTQLRLKYCNFFWTLCFCPM